MVGRVPKHQEALQWLLKNHKQPAYDLALAILAIMRRPLLPQEVPKELLQPGKKVPVTLAQIKLVEDTWQVTFRLGHGQRAFAGSWVTVIQAAMAYDLCCLLYPEYVHEDGWILDEDLFFPLASYRSVDLKMKHLDPAVVRQVFVCCGQELRRLHALATNEGGDVDDLQGGALQHWPPSANHGADAARVLDQRAAVPAVDPVVAARERDLMERLLDDDQLFSNMIESMLYGLDSPGSSQVSTGTAPAQTSAAAAQAHTTAAAARAHVSTGHR